MIYLNGNGSGDDFLAVGCLDELISFDDILGFDLASEFIESHHGKYIFGWFGYDLKNGIEKLVSSHQNGVNLPSVYLLVPAHLAKISKGELTVVYGSQELLEENLNQLLLTKEYATSDLNVKPTLTKEEYLRKVGFVKNHIRRGDIYEANFCYEFQGKGSLVPELVYNNLNQRTTAPFSAFIRLGDQYVMSASPERFIRKEDSKLISQPIKGTIRRGNTEEEDSKLIEQLRTNQKDRSENIMIVDLVRNDLSRIAEPSSVKVEELCGIYTFRNIHQMISTVIAEVKNKSVIDILKALFPMGSMTGAPKIRAMEIIEDLEVSRRGLYSGCIGYIDPNQDFDFNVVIRSIFYDDSTKDISFSVGGAITDLSDSTDEYEETLLKAEAMIKTLNS